MGTSMYLAEITLFAGNFAPRGTAFCQGQILAISTNTAVFSLLGTTYGGNGQTTFALPDLRGRSPIHPGQGPGLSPIVLGQQAGAENVTLTTSNLPQHNHTTTLNATTTKGNSQAPVAGAILGRGADGTGTIQPLIYAPAGSTASVALGAASITSGLTGSNVPFSLRNPYLGLNFIIYLQGIFPSRN